MPPTDHALPSKKQTFYEPINVGRLLGILSREDICARGNPKNGSSSAKQRLVSVLAKVAGMPALKRLLKWKGDCPTLDEVRELLDVFADEEVKLLYKELHPGRSKPEDLLLHEAAEIIDRWQGNQAAKTFNFQRAIEVTRDFHEHPETYFGAEKWSAAFEEFVARTSREVAVEMPAEKPGAKHKITIDKADLRSWTQPDLDRAIREYKAHRASMYQDLVDGVKRGLPGAKKSARKLFGRNAIARALGVKAHAMVSGSEPWKEIRDDLQLGQSRRQKRKIGMDLALEEQADAASEKVPDTVIRRETIKIVRQSVEPTAAADEIIDKLERNVIDDDRAREIAKAAAGQRQDRRAKKVTSESLGS